MKAKVVSSSEEESDCSSGDPEDNGKELAMLVKKFQKFTKKKGFRKSSRSSSRNDEASSRDHKKRTCHKCKKPGHYISECPQWDNENNNKKKSKKYDSDDKKKKKSSKSSLTFDRLTDFTNELQALGATEITKHEVVKTLLRSLDSSFDILALMIQECPDFKTLDPSDILERLNTHEFQLSEKRDIYGPNYG